jgi:hypothetical protein
MFTRQSKRWLIGGGLMLALAGNMLSGGHAFAAPSALAVTPSGMVPAGTLLTISDSGYGSGDQFSLWINLPAGTALTATALGQIDTTVSGSVTGIDKLGAADSAGNLSYTLDTTGLPNGNYSLVVHDNTSGGEQVLPFTIGTLSAAPAPAGRALQVAPGNTVDAGTMLTISGIGYGADDAFSMWLNLPAGTSLAATALGQLDTTVTGSVAAIDASAGAGADGALQFTLDTTGLPNGSYGLVVYDRTDNTEQVVPFTIKPNAPSSGLALQAAPAGPIGAGTMLTITGTGYGANEPVSFWINLPAGAVPATASLGQGDTTVTSSVAGLDKPGSTDAGGGLSYTLDTTGLPAGNYSLVGEGDNSRLVEVVNFTIQ